MTAGPRRPLIIAAIGLSLGCAADRIAGPDEVPVTFSATAAQRDASRGVIDDVASRVIRGSERLAASSELTDAIDAVDHAIARADAPALALALAKADRALAKIAGTDHSDAADLDAIGLALADARRLIER